VEEKPKEKKRKKNAERAPYHLPQYQLIEDRHDFDQVTDEDIWTYNVATDMGVIEITDEIYEEKLLNMQKGDKPWMVVILLPGLNDNHWHSTYVMKTLYFLARDYPEMANYGFINTHNEHLRECFDNNGIPQSIFVVDGHPNYQIYDAFGPNRYMEFMTRYQELALHNQSPLIPIPYGLKIYPHYWLKGIGRFAK